MPLVLPEPGGAVPKPLDGAPSRSRCTLRGVTTLAFALLALGSFRLTRLVGWDTITAPARRRLLHIDDAGKQTRPSVASWRWSAAGFVHCAWCVGFWISAAAYVAFELWPDATLIVMTPLAISAVVGVVAKNLDA